MRPGRPLLTYAAANGGICLVRADGTHPMRLTPRWKGTDEPAWSPGGRYVAVSRFAGYDPNGDATSRITVADGRGHVRWTFGAAPDNWRPLWSPDGRHISYFAAGAHGGGLGVARPDGSDDHGVASCISPGNQGVLWCPNEPTWSADGLRLAFVDRADLNSPPSIVSTLADGSDRLLLVADADWPAYAPKGPKLAYTGPNGSESTWSLFVADADGRNPRALTPPSRDVVRWPTWSRDGRFLAFERIPCSATCETKGEIVVVRADGADGEVVVATHVPDVIYQWNPPAALMAWSPGGKLIAFMRGRSLVVARAGEGGERVVVSRVGTSEGVSLDAWRPALALPAAKRSACPRR